MSLNAILQGNVIKVSMLFFLVGSAIMFIVKDIKKLFTKDKKKTIIYALILLLVFGLVGFLSSSKVLNDTPLNSFIGIQVLFLIMGGVHVWAMRKFFGDLSEDKTKMFNELFFTIGLLFLGIIAFYRVITHFKPAFTLIFLAATLVFLVPLLFYKLYEFALLIPVKIYEQWMYPLGENIKDPTPNELKDPLVISFEFKKTDKSKELTNFRVKAPANLEFGRLFYFFLTDYNERHPEGTIDFLDKEEKPNKWIFYKKPSFFRSAMYINPEKTTNNNSLKENDIIICERT